MTRQDRIKKQNENFTGLCRKVLEHRKSPVFSLKIIANKFRNRECPCGSRIKAKFCCIPLSRIYWNMEGAMGN